MKQGLCTTCLHKTRLFHAVRLVLNWNKKQRRMVELCFVLLIYVTLDLRSITEYTICQKWLKYVQCSTRQKQMFKQEAKSACAMRDSKYFLKFPKLYSTTMPGHEGLLLNDLLNIINGLFRTSISSHEEMDSITREGLHSM